MPIAGECLECCEQKSGLVVNVNDALQKVGSTKFTICLGEYKAHNGTNSKIRKSVIGRHEDPAFNDIDRCLLQLSCNQHTLCIMNTFFQLRDIKNTT